MWLVILQRLVLDFLLHLIYFPLWWYTGGMWHAARFCYGLYQTGNANLAPGVWLKNLFVPMFGQYDLQGRLVSFFMRLVNVIFRSLFLFIWLIVVVLLFFIWPVFPVAVIYMMLQSIPI